VFELYKSIYSSKKKEKSPCNSRCLHESTHYAKLHVSRAFEHIVSVMHVQKHIYRYVCIYHNICWYKYFMYCNFLQLSLQTCEQLVLGENMKMNSLYAKGRKKNIMKLYSNC
jgi:hypothetical protein